MRMSTFSFARVISAVPIKGGNFMTAHNEMWERASGGVRIPFSNLEHVGVAMAQEVSNNEIEGTLV